MPPYGRKVGTRENESCLSIGCPVTVKQQVVKQILNYGTLN